MSGTDTESPLYRRSTEIVLRFRWLFLALTVAITAAVGWTVATKLMVDNSTEYFAAGDKEVSRQLESFRDDFGRDDYLFVMVEGDVFSVPFLEKLNALHEELEQTDVELQSLGERKADRDAKRAGIELPAAEETPAEEADLDDFGDFGDDEGWGDEEGGTVVEQVTSLINFRQTLFEDGAIRVRGLMDEMPTADELPALKAEVLANPSMVGTVIGSGATHTVLMVRTQFMDEVDEGTLVLHFQEVAERYDADGFKVSLSGVPELNYNLNTLVLEDTVRLLSGAGFVMGLILVGLFRRPTMILAPLVVVGLSAAWALGGMAAVGAPMTILTSILPAFLVCVGLGDSIHIQSVYKDELEAGTPHHEAIVRAVASTGIPVAFTTMTTAAGLLSFRFATAPAIQEMGIAGAFGVVMAMVNSVVFLPIALSFERPKGPTTARAGEREKDIVDRLLDWCTRLSAHGKHRRIIAFGAVLAIIALAGMSQLRVYHNPLIWLGPDHKTTIGVMTMDENVGGVSTVNLVFDTTSEHGVKDRELLLQMEELSEAIQGFKHPLTGDYIVTSTVGLVDIVKETNRALHDGDEAHYRIPDTQRGVSDALLLFESAGPDELSRIVTGDLSRTHVTARVKWMDASSYAPFAEFVEQEMTRVVSPEYNHMATGTVYSILAVVESLIGDLLRSFGVALIAVTFMMIALLRNVKLGLVSMVPNLLPIAVVMGFMGFVGITIDLSNLVIASIIIGIAVDDTVHYLHQFKVGFEATGDPEVGIQRALDHAGRALVSTSTVLTLGFSVFLMSRLVSIQRFGLLIGMACMLALFIDLILAPALLRALYRRQERPPASKETTDVEQATK